MDKIIYTAGVFLILILLSIYLANKYREDYDKLTSGGHTTMIFILIILIIAIPLVGGYLVKLLNN